MRCNANIRSQNKQIDILKFVVWVVDWLIDYISIKPKRKIAKKSKVLENSIFITHFSWNNKLYFQFLLKHQLLPCFNWFEVNQVQYMYFFFPSWQHLSKKFCTQTGVTIIYMLSYILHFDLNKVDISSLE